MSSDTLQSVLDLVEAQLDRPLDLNATARAACFSRFHFVRAFRAAFHETPHQYLLRKRMEKARELLANTDLPITEVCFAVGFQSLGSFSAKFRQVVGWSPSVYRARVWEQRRQPRRFIPACYIDQFHLEPCLPPLPPSE